MVFNHLNTLNIGWSKNINECLKQYDLPEDYTTIKAMTIRTWKKLVTQKVEIKNTKRLIDDCYKTADGTLTPKTKTAHILEKIKDPNYTRKAQNILLSCTKNETKSIIIARFGMLECGVNFKGTMSATCKTCKITDNENHRLNNCLTYRSDNVPLSVKFDDIYSDDKSVVMKVLKRIELLWNTKTAHGTVRL